MIPNASTDDPNDPPYDPYWLSVWLQMAPWMTPNGTPDDPKLSLGWPQMTCWRTPLIFIFSHSYPESFQAVTLEAAPYMHSESYVANVDGCPLICRDWLTDSSFFISVSSAPASGSVRNFALSGASRSTSICIAFRLISNFAFLTKKLLVEPTRCCWQNLFN